jgi:hypothetical protein
VDLLGFVLGQWRRAGREGLGRGGGHVVCSLLVAVLVMRGHMERR